MVKHVEVFEVSFIIAGILVLLYLLILFLTGSLRLSNIKGMAFGYFFNH